MLTETVTATTTTTLNNLISHLIHFIDISVWLSDKSTVYILLTQYLLILNLNASCFILPNDKAVVHLQIEKSEKLLNKMFQALIQFCHIEL